jgi:hypothetical protein
VWRGFRRGVSRESGEVVGAIGPQPVDAQDGFDTAGMAAAGDEDDEIDRLGDQRAGTVVTLS